MRYFVTGGTGFVGSWVVKQLTDAGNDVTCLVRKTSNLRWLEGLPVQYCYGSLNDPHSMAEAIAQSDYILHIAGVTKALKPEAYYRGNVTATQNLLNVTLVENSKVRQVVVVSSQAACGPSLPGQKKTEEDPCTPLTDYGKSKLQADQIAQSFFDKLPITILRPPTVYGPRDTDVLEVFKTVKAGVNLKVGGKDPEVSIIHVFDLARGIITAATDNRATGQIFNICNPEPCVWSDVISILQGIMNKKVLNIPVPYAAAYAFAGIMELGAKLTGKPSILNRQKMIEVNAARWVYSSEKIRRILGFETEISLPKGLEDTYRWYLENKWL